MAGYPFQSTEHDASISAEYVDEHDEVTVRIARSTGDDIAGETITLPAEEFEAMARMVLEQRPVSAVEVLVRFTGTSGPVQLYPLHLADVPPHGVTWTDIAIARTILERATLSVTETDEQP